MGSTLSNILSIDGESSSSEDLASENSKECSRHCSENEMEYTTDAIESIVSPLVKAEVHFSSLTIERVDSIESKLDDYEKISLMFLLYDDHQNHIALQNMSLILQGSKINVITEWYKLFSTQNWSDKLIEALCVIQNYAIIRELGYHKKIVQDRFVPLNDNTALFISIIRKVLYRTICENLTNSEVHQFLNLIKSDFKEKKINFVEYDALYLEMFLLNWMTLKYITASDLTNLIKIFKVMEKETICDKLKSVVKITENGTLPMNNSFFNNVDNAISNNSTFSTDNLFDNLIVKNNITEDLPVELSHRYYMDPKNPGICLIINQEIFYEEFDSKYKALKTNTKLEARKGTNEDKVKLQDTFKAFGFQVIVKENLPHFDINKELTEVINSVRKEDSSLFICILSHGIEGKVYGSNSIAIEVKKIQEIISRDVKNLNGKPKVLILQSCQGNLCQEASNEDDDDNGTTTDSPSCPPTKRDMLTFWATVPGYQAIRHMNEGTWFIQSLCNKMKYYADTRHFGDICTLVKQEVTSKRWGTKLMVPLEESTLSKFIYLPPALK